MTNIKKIMCIDNTAPSHPDCKGSFKVAEWSIYTVVGGFTIKDEYFYLIKEDEGMNGWNSIYFIPLSDVENKMFQYGRKRVRQVAQCTIEYQTYKQKGAECERLQRKTHAARR